MKEKKEPDLIYVERFKVAGSTKDTFDYFGVLKVKLKPGIVVSAKQIKDEIEKPDNFDQLKCVLALAGWFADGTFQHACLQNFVQQNQNF